MITKDRTSEKMVLVLMAEQYIQKVQMYMIQKISSKV